MTLGQAIGLVIVFALAFIPIGVMVYAVSHALSLKSIRTVLAITALLSAILAYIEVFQSAATVPAHGSDQYYMDRYGGRIDR